ncbi:PAS domain-containing protein, partial [Stutzerimonas stutzeri]
GEVIEGIAAVNEAAITGESAPVIRESGGDRSAVTGNTRVVSDWLLVRIGSDPGESTLDRMIALVVFFFKQKTAYEIASIGVWEYRDHQHSLHWDAQLKAMAGIPPEQPGLDVHEVLARVHPDDRGKLIRALGETLAGEGDGEFQLDYRIYDTRIDDF